MNRKEIRSKLEEIFRDVFDDDGIVLKDSTSAKDIDDWDSLTHITLIAEIEDELNLKFAMKDVVALKNVSDLLDLIEKLI